MNALLRLGAIAGAIMGVLGLAAYLSGLFRPQSKVLMSVANWQAMGKVADGRYGYSFDLKLRNVGNRSVSASPDATKPVKVCANIQARPNELSPLVQVTSENSMGDNVLQLNVDLPWPFISSKTVRVTLTSPKPDLGGVYIYTKDALLVASKSDATSECHN